VLPTNPDQKPPECSDLLLPPSVPNLGKMFAVFEQWFGKFDTLPDCRQSQEKVGIFDQVEFRAVAAELQNNLAPAATLGS
jgi:hypothetical protein